jgi:hypothetical protein
MQKALGLSPNTGKRKKERKKEKLRKGEKYDHLN